MITFTNTEQRFKTILKEIITKAEFKPNLTKLSKDTGIPITTIHDHWEKAKRHYNIDIVITEKQEESKKD